MSMFPSPRFVCDLASEIDGDSPIRVINDIALTGVKTRLNGDAQALGGLL